MDDPRTAPWPPAAAALNLTGLGLGYLLLRRWWFAATYLVLTAGLVLLAFATDAAGLPWSWRAIALLWVLGAAAHAWQLARRAATAAETAPGVVPLVLAVVLLVVEAAGYTVYVGAGDRAWDTAVAAQSRGDCAVAAPMFAQVSGIYELTLSPHAAEATDRGEECAALVEAGTARADGRPADAIRAYREFRGEFPQSALRPVVDAALPHAFAEWGAALRRDGDPGKAVGIYRDGLTEPGSAGLLRPELADAYLESATRVVATLPYNGHELAAATSSALDNLLTVRREFADTPAAGRVGAGLTALLAALGPHITTIGSCPGLIALDALARIPADLIAEIAAPFAQRRAQELLACGIQRYGAGRLPAAVEAFAEIEKSYPQSPEFAQARSARIAADVAIARNAAAPALPGPFAGDEVGPVPVTFYNVTGAPVQVLVGGTSVHQIELPACTDCGPDVQRACGTARGRPSGVLRVRPGTYDVVSRVPPGTPKAPAPRVGTVTAAVVDGEIRPVHHCVSTGP